MGAHFAHDATAATGNGSSHFQLCTSPCSHCGYNGSNLPSHFKVSYFVYLYIQVLFRRKNIPGCGVNVQEVARESSRKVSSLIRKHLSAEFKPWCVCVCICFFKFSSFVEPQDFPLSHHLSVINHISNTIFSCFMAVPLCGLHVLMLHA